MTSSPENQQRVRDWLDRQGSSRRDLDVSIVIPAYNEEDRLPPTLVDVIEYFDKRGDAYELIVVDDGSRDKTSQVVKEFERVRSQVRLIRLPKNYGKGHAVRTGALNAKGKLVLFTDADGSTPIEEIERLEAAILQGHHVAFGSRAMASQEIEVTTRWHRRFIGRSFNFVVSHFILPQIADTQCGFKLFQSPAADFIFTRQSSDGFSFDLELLFIARKANMSLQEVAVNWHDVTGSKLNLVLDGARMFRDIFIFRIVHRAVTPRDFEDFQRDTHPSALAAR